MGKHPDLEKLPTPKETLRTDAWDWAKHGRALSEWRKARPCYVAEVYDFGGQSLGPREVAWAIALKGVPHIQFKSGIALDVKGTQGLVEWLEEVLLTAPAPAGSPAPSE